MASDSGVSGASNKRVYRRSVHCRDVSDLIQMTIGHYKVGPVALPRVRFVYDVGLKLGWHGRGDYGIRASTSTCEGP